MSYSAAVQGGYTVIVPWFMKNKDGWQGRSDWYTGLTVQNLGSSTATVSVDYYNNDGTPQGFEPDRDVPAKASHVYNPAPSYGGVNDTYNGSAVVTANQPIAVVVNLIVSGSTDDTAMSYTGVNQ
jgi:hypothetical protein